MSDAAATDAPSTSSSPVADQWLHAATGLAQQFARDYLTWDATAPHLRAETLRRYVGEDADPQLGWDGAGVQVAVGPVVLGVEVEDEFEADVTVAVLTTGEVQARWTYLAVPVQLDDEGRPRIAASPRFVPAPAVGRLQTRVAGTLDAEAAAAAWPAVEAAVSTHATSIQDSGLAPTLLELEVPIGGDAREAVARVRWSDAVTGSAVVQDHRIVVHRDPDGDWRAAMADAT